MTFEREPFPQMDPESLDPTDAPEPGHAKPPRPVIERTELPAWPEEPKAEATPADTMPQTDPQEAIDPAHVVDADWPEEEEDLAAK